MAPGIEYIEQHYGSDLIISMLKFTLEKVEQNDVDNIIETVAEIVTEETRGEMMTLAEQLEQRGIQQGILQGEKLGMQACSHEIAKKMLVRGEFNVEIIANITDLAIDAVHAIKAELE